MYTPTKFKANEFNKCKSDSFISFILSFRNIVFIS